jgi:hypothetical protein
MGVELLITFGIPFNDLAQRQVVWLKHFVEIIYRGHL